MEIESKRRCLRSSAACSEGSSATCSEGSSEGESGERVKSDVGRMVDSSQADDRRLIRLVRERRLLYARNNMPVASYYTRVKKLWDDVARSMGWSVADARRKWSHIRNSYSRHLRNEMHGTCTSRGRMVSRWYLADELEFLREHMATDMRPTSFSPFLPTMVDSELPEPAAEAADVKPFLRGPWFARAAPPSPARAAPPAPPAPPAPSDDSCGSTAFGPEENSSYFQFFRGIYGDYQELSGRKRRLFKRQCLSLLHDLLDTEDIAQIRIVDSYHQESVLNLSNSGHGSEDDRDKKPNTEECYILSNTTY